jgi:hypothetical protein
MKQQGFVKMPRGLREWGPWAEATPAHRAVLQELLFSAEWRAVRRRGRWLLPGQCLTSYSTLQDACNVARGTAQRAVEYWDRAGIINCRRAAGRTLVTVLWWNRFQGTPGTGTGTAAVHPPESEPVRGAVQGNGDATSGTPRFYDDNGEGGGTGGGTPSKSHEGAPPAQGPVRQGARATEKKFEEVKNPPSFCSFSSPHSAGTVPDDPPVAVPESLRGWLEGLNGSMPEETLARFWRDVERRCEAGHGRAVRCAMHELAEDPPDLPAALVSYWEKIVERHVYNQRRDEAERKEQERNRRERQRRDDQDHEPPDIDWDGVKERISRAGTNGANNGALKAGNNGREHDDGPTHTGGAAEENGGKTETAGRRDGERRRQRDAGDRGR